METLTAIGFLLGLASVLAIVLAVANAKLKVFEDPRIDHVQEMLPNSNCGACGAAGCRAFAELVVSGKMQPSGCTVGGPTTAQAVADYLGVEAGEAVKRVARLLCAGGSNVAIQMSEYQGHKSCRAAAAVGGGGKGCRYGCLGFGDCFDVCDFDADNDGVLDEEDNCPIVPNAGQEDLDDDGIGNACDNCDGSQADSDSDGQPDAWQDFSQTGGDMDGNAVRAQVFTANGKKSGGEFLERVAPEWRRVDDVVG